NTKSSNAVKASLSQVGQEHNSISPTGFEVAKNALDSETRHIITAQENALRAGFEKIERSIVEMAANAEDVTSQTTLLTDAQRSQAIQDVTALLTVFYISLYPIFGRQLLSQRALEYGAVVPYEMTEEAQA